MIATEPPLGNRIDDALTSRNNSLNFLRLVLAVAVLASHAVPLGGFGANKINGRSTLGSFAVFGFFGISGYLVAQSASRNSTGRYLWQRFLRIFPGYWVCLLVMVVVFGTIGWFQLGHNVPLSTFWGNQGLPYIAHNFLVRMTHPFILGTKTYQGLPLQEGSGWTLYYEFLCYLILAGLAVTRLFKRRWFVVSLTGAVWITEIVVVVTQHPSQSFDAMVMLTLVPIFLTGTVLYLFRDEVWDSGWIALGCSAVVVASAWLPIGQTSYNYLTNFISAGSSVDMLAPFIVYPMLWLGTHLPLQKVGSSNDYSYGIYIYAYPVQRLLGMWNVQRLGFIVFLVACIVCTLPFAIASWWLVEKPALRLKRISPSSVSNRIFGPKSADAS